jgi:hypothetical protein
MSPAVTALRIHGPGLGGLGGGGPGGRMTLDQAIATAANKRFAFLVLDRQTPMVAR